METMIDVQSLTVAIGGRKVLRDVNLRIARGETVALFGPNGCGKTSLLGAIMGRGGYRVESGRILFHGREITGLSLDERARLGIGLAFQRPPALRGVKLGELLRICGEKNRHLAPEELPRLAWKLHLVEFLQRDVNLGFSGGEIKRSELLQLISQAPSFVMLDEPDSGVDLVNIRLVAQAINDLLDHEKGASRRMSAGLIVTHSGHILDYVPADRGYVMLDGTVYCSGKPHDLLEQIRARGYEECVQCQSRT